MVVTTLADSGPGSLRAAIANANSGDTISFAVTGTITNLSGEILIGKDLSIVGPGAANLAVSGNGTSRVFNIAGGASVNLSALTICNGHARDGAAGTSSATPGSPGADGGGIYNSGTLTLTNCVITRCRSGQGGAGYSAPGWPSPDEPSTDGGVGGNGGGIHNAGTLTLAACTLSYNTNGSGGSGGNATRVPSYPGGAGASGGSGAGIYDAGSATVVACTFGFNRAGAGGVGGSGGTGSESGPSDGAAGGRGGDGGSGGGLYNQASPTLVSCTLAGNAGGSGGQGGQGGTGYSVFSPLPIGPAGNGGPGGDGGAGGSGGGLYVLGFFQSVACTVTTNAAGKGGNGGQGGHGGITSGWGLAGGNGGTGGNGGSGGAGGGAYTWGGSSLQNVLAAQDSAGAGGLAGAGGAAGTGHPTGSGGSPGSSGSGGSGPDLLGAFTSNGYNLIGLGDGCSGFTDGVLGDIVGSATPLDPVLGPLTNNSGPTFTCAVLCGSPALDTGDDTLLGAPWNLAADQRGLPRKSGSHVDIGAYEVQRAASPICVAVCATTTNGAVQMTATNVPGASLTVLAATSLASPSASWTALGLMPEIAPGQFQFLDPAPTNLAQRFYRLRCP
jgi:hypothetical protein